MSKIQLPKSVMAAINFKGGTGKTTVAIAIAEGLCRSMGKRVAVVDCDFQCSASIAMVGRRTLNGLMQRNATMDAELLSGFASKKKGARQGPHLAARAVPAQFCVSEAMGLMHILPGSHNMPRYERQIVAALMPRGDIEAAYANAAIEMAKVFRSLLDDFDFVLIDCPPGLTLFSEAAIRAADGLIIPTLPNEISFAAIDHLRAEIERARPDRSFDDLLVGTVVSKVRQKAGSATYRAHMESIERLLDRVAPQFQLLKPYLPYCKELEAATWRDNDESKISFAARYGSFSVTIERLVQEFASRCGELMARRQPA